MGSSRAEGGRAKLGIGTVYMEIWSIRGRRGSRGCDMIPFHLKHGKPDSIAGRASRSVGCTCRSHHRRFESGRIRGMKLD